MCVRLHFAMSVNSTEHSDVIVTLYTCIREAPGSNFDKASGLWRIVPVRSISSNLHAFWAQNEDVQVNGCHWCPVGVWGPYCTAQLHFME